MQKFLYRNIEKTDLPNIHKWLALPYIAKWIHGNGLQSTLSGLENCITGSEKPNRYWIASDDTTDFAFLISGFVDQTEADLESIDFVGNKAVSLDIFIGNEDYLGKGLSSQLISDFLLTQFPDASDFIIDPEKSNERAIHVYNKVGFETVSEFIAPWHPVPHLMMHVSKAQLETIFTQTQQWPRVDQDLAQLLIEDQFPQYYNLDLKPVPFSGWDNRTFRLGKELLLRLPSSKAYAAQVEKEQTWLPYLAKHLSFDIPNPIKKGLISDHYPCDWSIYAWIEGETLASTQNLERLSIAADLGRFLRELQSISAKGGPIAGKQSFFRGSPISTYDEQARKAISKLENKIDTRYALEIWESACSSTWLKTPVWVHGDFSPGNILIKDGKLAAVIDFGQLAVGDPACDYAIGWSYFDSDSRELFRTTSCIDPATWQRGRAWALWKAAITASGLNNTNPVELKRCWATLTQVLQDQ